MDLIGILQETGKNNRTSHYQRIADEQLQQYEEQAEILSFNDSGYRCRLLTGEVVLATAISNAGLYKGAIVSLVKCPGSLAIIDSMPR